MREIKYKGKTAYITEKDWKILLRRFDEKNTREKFGHYIINISCSLCERNLVFCGGCPLRIFQVNLDGDTGCIELMQSLVSKKMWDYLSISNTDLEWGIEEDKTVRKELKKIHDALLALPRRK